MPAEKIQIDKAVIFANENNQNAKKAVDGSFFSKWVGGQCPGYFEITLPGAFRVARLKLDAGKRGYSIFSVFASEDAENFSEVITQDSEAVTNGKYDFECGFVCRKIRIYIKYNSFSPYAQLKNIELFGEKTEKCKEKASPDFPCDFKDSKFNVAVTDKDTEDELHALVARTVGEKYSDCFIFEVLKSGEEFFELSDENGKIKIKGSNGVNIAYGLNHYYKYFCKVHISQAGNRTEMPDKLPEIGGKIKMSTPFLVRYAYNYCALSYTMAFMGEKEWQKELDWLALQGVNAVLDITAAEEVYRRFLMKIGYSLDEAKAFITGPAYYAWFNMANIFGVGGPLHSTFFKKHTELARKNHLFMRKMGMQPVLQGYSGMVPQDIASHFEGAPVIPQGLWNCLERPYMLKTDTDVYRSFARIFYECQRDVFGEVSHFYATDPFHEGGKSGSLKIENVGRQIIESILESDPDGIWIIQSWGENPSKALMDGIGNKKEHALVLDLYAEKAEMGDFPRRRVCRYAVGVLYAEQFRRQNGLARTPENNCVRDCKSCRKGKIYARRGHHAGGDALKPAHFRYDL